MTKIDPQELLPPEIWMKIFRHLSHRVLCSVVLVSKHLHSLGSDPSLWSSSSISRRKVKSHGLKNLMKITRFTGVTDLDMSVSWLTAGQCTSLVQETLLTNLQNLNLYGVDLSLVDSQLLAKAVARLCQVNLGWTRLTSDHTLELCNEILNSETLVDMNLFRVDLSDVPSYLLALAVSRVKTVKLTNTQLGTDQLVALLEQLMCPESRLQNLNLTGLNLSFVDPEFLAVALAGLVSFTLWGAKLTRTQCSRILEKMVDSTSLTSANLDSQDLSSVDGEVLGLAISRLCKASLFDSRLSTGQCVTLLKHVINSSSLTHLNLDCVAMGDVPRELKDKAREDVKILNS